MNYDYIYLTIFIILTCDSNDYIDLDKSFKLEHLLSRSKKNSYNCS